jgi:acetylornithine deacetylase
MRDELEPEMRAVADTASISFKKASTTLVLDSAEKAAVTQDPGIPIDDEVDGGPGKWT